MAGLTERERQIVAWLRDKASEIASRRVEEQIIAKEGLGAVIAIRANLALTYTVSDIASAIERGEPWSQPSGVSG